MCTKNTKLRPSSASGPSSWSLSVTITPLGSPPGSRCDPILEYLSFSPGKDPGSTLTTSRRTLMDGAPDLLNTLLLTDKWRLHPRANCSSVQYSSCSMAGGGGSGLFGSSSLLRFRALAVV